MTSSTLTIFLLLRFILPLTLSHATTFDIVNSCSFTVWAAALPGGGQRLEQGQTWSLNVNSNTASARIWARTGCSFDGSGRGRCQTGDCGGLLECKTTGTPPNTLAEYSLSQSQSNDFFDISLVDGFNVPMGFVPASGSCRRILCSANITARCPQELRAPGGCNGPCAVFKTDEYCCTGAGNCGPTNYSMLFKNSCPDVYTYPMDDATSTFTCPSGTNYSVVFCGSGSGRAFPSSLDGLGTGFGRIVVKLVIPEV